MNRDGPHFLRKENGVRPYLFPYLFRRPVESLRRHAHWKVADLCRNIEEGPWDIILWRNMAIYLAPDAAAAIWRGLAAALAPGGVLVVGKAERPPIELELAGVGRYIYTLSTVRCRENRLSQYQCRTTFTAEAAKNAEKE